MTPTDTIRFRWVATSEPPTTRGHYAITLESKGERYVKGFVWWSGVCRGPGCWPPNAVGYALIELPEPMGTSEGA